MNAQALAFNNIQFDIVSRNGQPWLSSPQIGEALGYVKGSRSVHKIYESNKAEFTDSMTTLVKLKDPNPQNGDAGQVREVRIFSLRGCHLLAMFARTKVAKDFRKWVLDILDKEVSDMITPEQQNALHQIVNRKAGADHKKRAALWSRFNNHYKLGSYKQLPASKFPDAVVYLDSIAEDAPALPFPETIRMLAVFEGFQMVKARQLNSKEVVMDVSDDKSLRTVFAEYLPLDKLSMLIRMATDRLEMAAQRSIQKRLK